MQYLLPLAGLQAAVRIAPDPVGILVQDASLHKAAQLLSHELHAAHISILALSIYERITHGSTTVDFICDAKQSHAGSSTYLGTTGECTS